MLEDLIAQLDEMGITYSEDPDTGTLTIDISTVEKADLVDVIIALNSAGVMFDITEDSITVQGDTTPMETSGEEVAADDTNYMDEALGQL